MAAINFPDSPSDGDTHVVGGVTYTYNSAETKWKTTINSNAFLPLTGGTVNGNIALDELHHRGDVDTNITFGTDEIQFDTAGSERFRVGSAGQLGIGGATYGTDGQVLTSGGASAAPAWEDLPASLSWTETTASSASGSSLEFTSLPSDFRELLIIFNNVSPTASSELEYQLGTGTGPTYATSGYAQLTVSTGSGTSYDNATTAHGRFSATNFAEGHSGYGYLRITNPTGNTYLCHGAAWSNDATQLRFSNTSIALSATLTAIKFYMDGGDFDSGNWKLLYVN